MKRLIKKLWCLSFILCSVVVLIFTIGCDLLGPEDDSDTEVTSTLELTGFTYSGTNDVYFTLYGSEGPGNGTAPVHSQKISDGIPGEDIVFDDLNIEEHEDEGEQVQLYIASDEDGSGALDTGDYIMPILRFDMYYGEYRQIPDLDLDTGTEEQAGVFDENYRIRFHINYGQLGPVNEQSPLILIIQNLGDPAFDTLANVFKIIPLADKGFINEIEFNCVFPDDTYHYLLFHDLDGLGYPDIGEASSTIDPINNVQDSFSVDLGTNQTEVDIDLTVSLDTPLY